LPTSGISRFAHNQRASGIPSRRFGRNYRDRQLTRIEQFTLAMAPPNEHQRRLRAPVSDQPVGRARPLIEDRAAAQCGIKGGVASRRFVCCRSYFAALSANVACEWATMAAEPILVMNGLTEGGASVSWSDVIAILAILVTILVYYLARKADADARRIEAAKAFLDLQQSRYTEALALAAILSNPETHTDDEFTKARKRFHELYVAELSMVEAPMVESKMVSLAAQVDPELLKMTEAQKAAFELAHALRDSLLLTYGIKQK
jgi:hypothetical protein